MARTATRPENGERRKDIEDWLDENGVTWSYVADLPLEDVDRDRSLHNQARLEPLQESVVEEYREALRRGDRFPAIVVARGTGRGKAVNVDGNHRFEAARLEDLPSFGAYVVHARPNTNLVIALTMAANVYHGMVTSVEERVQHALWFIDSRGLGVDAAAAKVNLPSSTVRTRYDKVRADRRADDVGLRRSDWESLASSARTRLLSIGTDEGFKAGARLAIAARLSIAQIEDLVSAVNEFPKSAAKQEKIVRALRKDYADRIAEVAGGKLTSARAAGFTPRRRLTLALTNLMALPEDFATSLATSFDEEERHEAAARAHEAAGKLEALAAALEA